jgi:predicted metal-dependent phosphoesterase TrpH
MKIDLHIHSKNCSDGRMTLEEIFKEAKKREIDALSISDHDSVDCQDKAQILAQETGIKYITGMELSITFSHPEFTKGKSISLDFLAYNYDYNNQILKNKLKELSEYRNERALKIMEKVNEELKKENIEPLTPSDIKAIQDSVDGVFGRPHIARYLVKKGIVKDKQEAFDRYLVRCNVPKFPLLISEASKLVHDAGGKLVFAHPADPHGTSLVKVTDSLRKQTEIIENAMLPYIDGIECWHSRIIKETTDYYVNFARSHNLLLTGGSDCHQNPIIMGSVDIPDFVYMQFESKNMSD